MNICVVVHLFPARSETFVINHVLGLAERGHKVAVLARERDEGVSEIELRRIREAGVEVFYTGSLRAFSTKVGQALNILRSMLLVIRSPAAIRLFVEKSPWGIRDILLSSALVDLIKSKNFDLVHVHFGDLAARLQFVSRLRKAFPPMVVTWHGSDANAVPKNMGPRVFDNLFASEALHTVGTNFLKRRLMELGASGGLIKKIPMGIDIQQFRYREREGRGGEVFEILSVGRLDEVKGHAYLVDACSRLISKGHIIRLRIAGDGPLRCELEQQIAQLGIRDNVTLLGAVTSDEVVREMLKADLFALTGTPSKLGKIENQAMVLLEAQATGLPVVSSRIGGIPESVLDGKTGMLCEPGDVEGICMAIEKLIINRGLMRELGSNGRRHVEENFALEAMLSSFDDLYAAVCN